MRIIPSSVLCAAGMVLPLVSRGATNIILSGSQSTAFGQPRAHVVAPWQVQLVVAVVMAAGLVNLFFPRVGWWLKVGWQFRDAPEPSGLWLFFARLGGFLIFVVTGAVLCRMNGIDFGLPISK